MVEGEENADEVQVANSQPLSQRKLPDLPPEAHKSVGTRIWASIKQKIGSGPNPHNSQIVSGMRRTYNCKPVNKMGFCFHMGTHGTRTFYMMDVVSLRLVGVVGAHTHSERSA